MPRLLRNAAPKRKFKATAIASESNPPRGAKPEFVRASLSFAMSETSGIGVSIERIVRACWDNQMTLAS
jgi:hypothetical protein